MKTSNKIIKKLQVRKSADFDAVLTDYPIGHQAKINEIPVFVTGHQNTDVLGKPCLFVIFRAKNGDGVIVDPYLWNLAPAKE